MAPRRPSTSRALARSLKARPLEPWEEATAALARRLAQEIDAADDPAQLARLAGRYRAVLADLGMTRPAGRPPTTREEPGGGPAPTALERIRAARARQHPSAAVDPAPEGPV